MQTPSVSKAELWKEYRREICEERLPSLEIASLCVLVGLSAAFVVIDASVHPGRFWPLVEVRGSMVAAVAAAWMGLGRSRASLSAVLGSALVCLMLVTLIYETGGPSSNYFAGLMLGFASVPVLLPLSAFETIAVVVPAVLGFLVSPWLTSAVPTWNPFGLHAFYLGSSAIVAIVSAGLLDRGRFAEFRRRREAEEARDKLQELDRAKSRFTANVHHELRTPLTLLLAPLEAMQAGEFGPLSALQYRSLATMHANALRLLKLLSSVLDLAKSEAGELRLRPQRADVAALASRVFDAARPLAARKGVELETRGLKSLPALSVDCDALDQVLVNLLGNALKFTPSGGKVELRAQVHPKAVELVVSDTGAGLAAKDRERVFERFAQVDDSTTRQFEGTGIGLAIAREIVERHSGRIWADSAGLGQGASFHVRLPRNLGELELAESDLAVRPEPDTALVCAFAALEAELDLIPEQGGGGGSGYSDGVIPAGTAMEETSVEARDAATAGSAGVLVVEDNRAMRNFLAGILGREFRVRTARDGAEGLAAINRELPDLVLADVMMPGVSGVELCRRLKEDERTRGIPVVLLTAKADRDSRIEGLEHGAEEYLPKPFHARELLARVRALVKLRTLQRELAIRNQELEVANAALGTSQRNLALYARAVSHDLRSPLAAASEALRLARAQCSGDRSKLLSLAGQNLDRADRMLEALRSLTRAAGADETAVSVDVDSLVSEVVKELALSRGGAALPIQVVAPLGTIQAPRQKLAHIFRNLLRNAMEALEGAPNPHIEIGQLPGGETGFYVRDNGPGIPYEYQARLFEPFRRGPRTRPENMGLGLALVQQLVEQRGGKVSLDSAPGQGTIFRLTFPKD